MKNNVLFQSHLPTRNQFPVESVLFYDQILDSKPFFKKWKKGFQYQMPLKAGESLKTLESLQKVLKKLSRMSLPQTTQLTFIAVGGGSVGDFVGFLSSIFLRGRIFVQIPSTWLAAIDSAHGGKNALNFDHQKNQLGTVYTAHRVYIVHQLLTAQPQVRLNEAMGEVIKMGVINSPHLFEQVESNEDDFKEKNLISILPQLIAAKMKVVQTDLYETKGLRRVLNLGHTMGHVFESHYKMAHGEAVLFGTLFAARFSFHLGLLKENDFIRISNLIFSFTSKNSMQNLLQKMKRAQIQKLLLKDKKVTAENVMDFIFIKKIGFVIRQKVSVQKILDEVERQATEF
ncbi:MAG: 3-dehydroquinate synthase [Bdellovibrio sp.]|nr:3-dehydroquinate synthase [Bdellovibrio sp.]